MILHYILHVAFSQGIFGALFGFSPLLACAPGADGAVPNGATLGAERAEREGAVGYFHGVAQTKLRALRELEKPERLRVDPNRPLEDSSIIYFL